MKTEKEKRTLEDLVPGERGIILRVGSDKGAVKRRLVDMGLTPGTEVMVRKVAPFGDPIEMCIRDRSGGSPTGGRKERELSPGE